MSNPEQTDQAAAARQLLEYAGRNVFQLILSDTHQEEVLNFAEQLGIDVNTLFLILGFLMEASVGYLFFLLIFCFIMPVALFIFLAIIFFLIYQVRDPWIDDILLHFILEFLRRCSFRWRRSRLCSSRGSPEAPPIKH